MKLTGAPRLRRQRARRHAAVRRAIDTVGQTVDRRTWSLKPAQYARFLDLYFGEDGLGAAETDELDQLWAWCVAGFGAPAPPPGA